MADPSLLLSDDDLVALVRRTAAAIVAALAGVTDWGPSGHRADQYASDVVADEAATAVLLAGGVGVLSEETGVHAPERAVRVVVDPLDGSTNASIGLPWYGTSLAAVGPDGLRVGLVHDLVRGTEYLAVRGRGATADGRPLRASGASSLGASIIGLSALPTHHYGWGQFRCYGAAALDLCMVASGVLDGWVDCGAGHSGWDYLGGLLLCQEAGAVAADAFGRDLVVVEPGQRRVPVVGASPAVLDALLAARSGADPGPS